MESFGEVFDPAEAVEGIRGVERRVAESRRWHIATLVGGGLVSIAYFALLGWSSHKTTGPAAAALIACPSVAFALARNVRGRHPVSAGRGSQRDERVVSLVYVLLLLPVGIAADLLPHPMPAALTGIVPAAVCFAGAWRVARR